MSELALVLGADAPERPYIWSLYGRTWRAEVKKCKVKENVENITKIYVGYTRFFKVIDMIRAILNEVKQ